jgi:hypothetical protein
MAFMLVGLIMVMAMMAESRECDMAMMTKCCGHMHRLRHFTTFDESRAYLKEHKAFQECPRWFKMKCQCNYGRK